MHHAGLPENYKLTDIMDMFRENFERVLVENGGKIVGDTYYIPKTNFRTYDYVKINNYNFETGDLAGWTSLGGAAPESSTYAFYGEYALKVSGDPSRESGAYQTVSGLKVGSTYRLDAYALSSKDATGYLLARDAAGKTQTAAVSGQTDFVKRDLVFRATAETMQIGLMLPACTSTCYAIADELTLYRLEETTPSGMQITLPMEAATVGTIINAEGKYENSVRITVDGKSAREVLLKCTFANPSNAIVDAKITVNGESFDTVPFYKTGTITKNGVDVAYIPVVLDKDVNTVDLAYDGKVLYMKNVEAVIERTRTVEADLNAITFREDVSTTPKTDGATQVENANVVYLGGTGAGDGSSPEKALNNLMAAYDALDLSKDCTIVVCGEFTQAKSFNHTSSFTGSVTLTSVYGGVDYRGSGAAIVTPGARFVCNGKTIFKDIDFRLTGKYYCIVAQHYPLVMDTGVTMSSTDAGFVGTSFANGFDIIGGYQAGQAIVYSGQNPPKASDAPVDITIRSGSHYVIAAYSRQVTEPAYGGDATIRISGDAQGGTLYFAPVNTGEENPFVADGDITVELRDKASITNMFGTTNSATLGSLTLNWYGGTIDFFDLTNYSKATVKVTRGTTLNYSKTAEKASFFTKVAEKFDKKNATLVENKFSFTRDYADNFTDVTANAWFYSYVRDAYRIGLANGTSATKFSPDGSFTVAQALTAAANIHTIYNGKSVNTAGAKNWYDPYVDYCIANGIIKAGQFTNYNAPITRGDMAIVFANILPDSEYAAVRSGSNPDVTSNLACYAAVQKLYNAGIVGGDAGTGNYRPNDGIKRSEACVIFTRIAMADMRAK